jgi:opacity protein-like surface antigen
MCVRKWLVIGSIVAVAVVAAPRTASADWTLTPFVGWNFGGSADVQGSNAISTLNKFEKKIDYGASLAGMGKGVFGFEVDFGYSPNFFENSTGTNNQFNFTSKSNVTTFTGNAILGIPAGGQHGASIRPYLVGGVGLIRTNVQDAAQLFSVTSKNDFGYDIGGGLMGFFSTNIGLRGDVRYFRAFNGSSDNVTGLGLSDFKFWRGSLGLSLKF